MNVGMNDSNVPVADSTPVDKGLLYPFRVAVVRGLGVVLPPLLTIVIFLWIGGTIERYVVEPLTHLTRNVLVWAMADIRRASGLPADLQGKVRVTIDGTRYRRVDAPPTSSLVVIDGVTYLPEPSQRRPGMAVKPTVVIDGVTYRRQQDPRRSDSESQAYVPEHVYDYVFGQLGPEQMPRTAVEVYQRYVELNYLRPYLVILFFTPLFVIVLYLLGKFMAARIGRVAWGMFEGAIRRVPLVSTVYSPVKQVSEFLLNDRDIRASRVVAVEWPRKGMWALGLVTGESMADIEAAANEPVLSVLICTSPMPMTGFIVTVRKSETLDLNITIDQAFQFVLSCGVVVPPRQLRPPRDAQAPSRLTAQREVPESADSPPQVAQP